jgi:hypothetical protein
MKNLRARLTAAGLVAILALAAPAAAFAQTDSAQTDTAQTDRVTDQLTDQQRTATDIASVKRRALAAIEHRLVTIDRLQAAVRSNPHVTDDHAATLLSELERSANGLSELARQIEATEDPEELRRLIPKIAEDYRIYVLMVPKVHEVLSSDTVEHVARRFEIAEEELGEAIARAEEAGYEVGQAKEYLAEMIRYVDEAEALGGPVAEAVLPLQPADWPDPAKDILEQGHEDLVDARRSLREAWQAAKSAVRALHEAIGD